MRMVTALAILMLFAVSGSAQDRPSGAPLRGLNEDEVAALRAGTGMGLARAAELNSYPGPRHVLDADAEGKLTASHEQLGGVQRIFNAMKRDAQRVGAQILEEERQLEEGFRAATITEPDLRALGRSDCDPRGRASRLRRGLGASPSRA